MGVLRVSLYPRSLVYNTNEGFRYMRAAVHFAIGQSVNHFLCFKNGQSHALLVNHPCRLHSVKSRLSWRKNLAAERSLVYGIPFGRVVNCTQLEMRPSVTAVGNAAVIEPVCGTTTSSESLTCHLHELHREPKGYVWCALSLTSIML